MKYRFILYFSVAVCLLLAACGRHDEPTVEVMRLERTIMDSSEESLPAALQQFAEEFDSPLLTLLPRDEAFMAMVREYRCDTMIRDIDRTVRQRYGDLGWLGRTLAAGVGRVAKEDSAFRLRKVATFIGSGGYDSRVQADRESSTLVVAIDQYAVGEMERYGFFGDPLYLVRMSDSSHLAVDCLAALAHEYIAMPPEPWTLLDIMVAEGKELYVLEQALPRTADSVRLRYTRQQTEWMEQHEGKVWAYLMHNQLLFSNEVAAWHNLIDEAPQTNAFGNESAPRTVEYIGWQMVRQYMKRSGSSLHALLEETDARKILNESGYRPK